MSTNNVKNIVSLLENYNVKHRRKEQHEKADRIPGDSGASFDGVGG